METFAQRFKRLREARGWTQYDIAEKLGVRRPTIAGYESGNKGRIPRRDMLLKIAELFDVTMDELIGADKPVSLRPESEGSLIRMFPIVAEIPCGEPALTEDRVIGEFPVDTSVFHLSGGEYVWLKAKGDSMINADIRDGSLVLIRLQNTADNRDIVAVNIDDENATLKRLYMQDGTVVLKPENDSMPLMFYDKSRVRIVGKAVMVTTYLLK